MKEVDGITIVADRCDWFPCHTHSVEAYKQDCADTICKEVAVPRLLMLRRKIIGEQSDRKQCDYKCHVEIPLRLS